jgi:hypothetical protein
MLLLLASFVVLAVFVFRQALQRTPIAKKYVLVLFIHIAIFLVAILWVTPLYRYTNNILPLNEPFFQERAGQVQQVKRLGKLPYHYVDGEFRYGMLLTIDGAEYHPEQRYDEPCESAPLENERKRHRAEYDDCVEEKYDRM